MEAVKVWCFSVCVSLVVGSALSMIVPSLDKYKIMKLTISAFILVGIVTPIINNADDINFDFELTEQTIVSDMEEKEMDENIINELQQNVTQSLFPFVKYELHMLNISDDFGINVELNALENGVSIEKVNITLSDLHTLKKDEIISSLEKNLGLPISLEVV